MKPFPTIHPPSEQFLQCFAEEQESTDRDDEGELMIVDIPAPTLEKRGKTRNVQKDQTRRFRNEAGRFQCPSCDKSFAHLTHLSRHRKVHKTDTVEDINAVTCRICGKVFSRPDSMQRHRKVHTENYPSHDKHGQVALPTTNKFPKSNIGSEHHPQDAGSASTLCPACGAIFPRVSHMLRHLQNYHGGESSTCPAPSTSAPFNPAPSNPASTSSFQSAQEKNDAEQMMDDKRKNSLTDRSRAPQSREHSCPMCDKMFTRNDSLNAHIKKYHNSDSTPISLFDKDTSRVDQTPQSPFPNIFHEDPQDHLDIENGGNGQLHEVDAIDEVLRKHWVSVRTHYTTGRPIQDVYNFRLIGHPPIDVDKALRMIFHRLRCRAKINLSFGFILRHIETGQLRYFHASQNNARLFSAPETIASKKDMERLIERVREADILQHGFQRRPDTKWTVASTANVTVYVNKMPQFSIGSPVEELPAYVANNRGLRNLLRNRNTGKTFDDNLCFFRCLAVHRGANIQYSNEKVVHELLEKYRQATGKLRVNGITLDEVAIAEVLFEVNVQVYTLIPVEDDGDNDKCDGDDDTTEGQQCLGTTRIQAELIRRSHRHYPDTLYLNLCGNHFSYISDLSKYSQTYACSKCSTVFNRSWNLLCHELTCDANVKHKFSGGSYQLPLSVFDKLSEFGVEVEKDMKYYPYRATFDYECYFQSVSQTMRMQSGKLRWENRHEILSVSVASNVPGLEAPRCFVSKGDPAEVVADMVNYLHKISEVAYANLLEKFESIFGQIDELIDKDDEQRPEGENKKHPVEKVKDELEEYLQELPVLGFNSGKYDINVIKRYLYPVLQKTDPLKLIIKRTGTYMALKTQKLKFLDIMNYLAPGYSYDKFLKAYDCPQTKGFFPYEWLDDLSKLDHQELPPHEAFYSQLKGANISKDEYEYCRGVWKKLGMSTVREFLVWYNNLDVVPFLEAVEKMFAFYRERQMDMFKSAISVPGLSLQYLFLTLPKHTHFALIDEANNDLYYTIKQNIVGGPSLVFHRYHEKGKTFIRGGSKQCQNIVGFDANALYLWSLMQDMPVGNFVRRKAEQGFKPVQSQKWGVMAAEWMEWVAHCQGIHIRHKFNGKEKQVGYRRLPVDGYCKETNTAYQFQGCFWHGHRCHLNPGEYNHIRGMSRDELRRQTEQTSAYIRQQGYRVVEMWECEWQHLQATDNCVRDFVASTRLPHHHRKTMTQREVLQAVVDGSMFGLVECDITVPEALKEHFAEMPPIFKNVDIGRADIGDHMRSYAEREGIMKTPRRSLIGSMFGKRILLATPLLQWYLKHGLEVLHVYEVVQFKKSRCFEAFGNAVSDARRAGDADPTKAILADTMKLLGNSAYGKTVTNQERHMNVRVCNDREAPRYVNKPHFRALHTLGDDVYEVDMAKKMIRLNLPLQIGFFVYQYAKMRMLEFYYDFLLKFVHPSDFQMCEMDTDSAYLAISEDTLDHVIKEEMKEQYQREKHCWFPREDTAAHRAYDKRTPGLFKVEWQGDGIIALCSKTYYCFGSKNKISCKGLNKRNNDITKQQYMDVLESQKAGGGINRGFRMRSDGMYTYEQVKMAFSYLYPKRKVAEDGVSTSYLDL